jgi:hypothetical protein
VVRGTATAIAKVLKATGGGTVINTASIERLNATRDLLIINATNKAADNQSW